MCVCECVFERECVMIIQKQRLQWLGHLLRMNENRPQNNYFAADLVMQQDQHMGLNRDG